MRPNSTSPPGADDRGRITALDDVLARLINPDGDFKRLRRLLTTLEPLASTHQALVDENRRLQAELAETLETVDKEREQAKREIESLIAELTGAIERADQLAAQHHAALERLDEKVAKALQAAEAAIQGWQVRAEAHVTTKLNGFRTEWLTFQDEIRREHEQRWAQIGRWRDDFATSVNRQLDDLARAHTLLSNRQREAEDYWQRHLARVEEELGQARATIAGLQSDLALLKSGTRRMIRRLVIGGIAATVLLLGLIGVTLLAVR